MTTVVLDPGHGGETPSGKSTPYGHRPAGGAPEKALTLALAQEVAARLGSGVSLTRQGDHNLSLGQRQAAGAGARAFVSLHTGPKGGGSEVWVHPEGGAAAAALGGALAQSLGAPVRQDAPMAVLAPLPGGPAAALVEVDHDRAADPHQRSHLAADLAAGLRRFLGTAHHDPNDPDSMGQDEPIDDEAANAYGYQVRALGTAPEYPQASRYTPARAGHFTVPASPRSIRRIVIHITDGRTTSGAVSWFQSAQNTGKTASHYVIGQDGEVVQMVQHANIAHHAKGANSDSIGIEHVAESPATAAKRGRSALAPSDAQYAASAALVSWLCDHYGIPADRQHVLGHSEVGTTNHRDCPQSVWDWDHYMRLVQGRMSAPRVRGPLATGQELLRIDFSNLTGLRDFFSRIRRHYTHRRSWMAGVSDTTVFPFSSICQLILENAAGNQAVGTGFYIGRETILTCGHNFYDNNDDGTIWETRKVTVQPGHSPVATTFPTRRFDVVGGNLVHPRWKAGIDGSGGPVGWDLAVLRVPGFAPPHGQWFTLPNMSPAVEEFFVCGFGKTQSSWADMMAEPMRCDGGPVSHFSTDTIEYVVNTEGGNSGSPVFVNSDDAMVVAVHTGGSLIHRRRANRGVYLGPDKVDWIRTRADPSA